MQEITVGVQQLLETLKENREKHRETFEEAVEKYRLKAIEVFEENIDHIKEGGQVRQGLFLPEPEDHTRDYDQAIQMLEWHETGSIKLSRIEFQQLVQDDWGWKQSWMQNTVSYAAVNGPKYYGNGHDQLA